MNHQNLFSCLIHPSTGNGFPGECSLQDSNRIMSVAEAPRRTVAVRDLFGFYPQYGSDDQVTFYGLSKPLYLKDGMAITFQLYTALVNEETAVLTILLNKQIWLALGVTRLGKISIG